MRNLSCRDDVEQGKTRTKGGIVLAHREANPTRSSMMILRRRETLDFLGRDELGQGNTLMTKLTHGTALEMISHECHEGLT